MDFFLVSLLSFLTCQGAEWRISWIFLFLGSQDNVSFFVLFLWINTLLNLFSSENLIDFYQFCTSKFIADHSKFSWTSIQFVFWRGTVLLVVFIFAPWFWHMTYDFQIPWTLWNTDPFFASSQRAQGYLNIWIVSGPIITLSCDQDT